ncbi:hypothetical protein AQUCO_01500025v1 [Aquilegia coerulea]|nr:hypothetical protein AQUCO_01500025v1 [Aquilegia coerulea]
MAELGQQTVDFSMLVHRAAEDSFLLLKELVEQLKKSEQSDTEKKISILKYIQKTRQRMLRLDVVAKWCRQVPVVQYCQQLASTLSSHDTCFTQAADSLFFMHEGLQQARAPIYDVPSAIEVLLTGSYQRLPKCIEDMGVQSSLTEDQQKPALKKLETLLRSRLLEITLPKEISEVKVSDGTVHLCVNGEFKVILTLGYRGHLSMWRILHLELLVGEKSGHVKLEESRRHVLGDDLERRMAAAENPFLLLYSILHELCVALIMDTVLRQVQALRQGRWRDAIRFELISDGPAGQGGSAGPTPMSQDGETDSSNKKIPGLKILYWLDFGKNNGGSDSGLCPYIKIEPSQVLQVKCLHSTFVIDPLTGKEADFSLDQSCVDVEKLLLRVISCNRYTRLLVILEELRKIGQICQAADDVLLQCYEDNSDLDMRKKDNKSNPRAFGGKEVLRVRAYNSSYITLGINIRSGHFYLQSSRNVLTASSLSECEEALNQGGMTAVEVFISLRSKSILRLIASVGKFLGLQVYEQGLAAVKIPNALLNGSGVLLMGLPQCGGSYFLLIQLDHNFKALFQLLETQQDSNGKFLTGGKLNQVIRFNDIDIDRTQMLRDESTLSLLERGNLISSFPNVVGSNQTSERGLLSECGLDASMQIAAGSPQSSFSSVVNELFALEKGMSAPPFPVRSNLSSSFITSPTINLGSVPINYQKTKFGITSPKWDGSLQQSSPGRSPALQKLSSSKSEQDITSLRSAHAVEAGSAINEHQVVYSSRSSRLLHPLRPTGPSVTPVRNVIDLGSPTTTTRNAIGSSRAGQAPESGFPNKSNYEVSKYDINPRKRSISDLLSLVPSLEGTKKRRKLSETALRHTPASQVARSSDFIGKIDGCSYGNLLAEANKGNAPSSIYVTALLHVVKHCSLCIKHARLTSQMAALDIPYIEEAGLQIPSSNVWFRLPFAREMSWQHLCLRLGRPGSMSWDVKIDDQHFRDLWELQKGSTNTPWGSGVRIATASDIDSHIRYDSDGVILTYESVEDDSIKKLVADISRLFNARLFSLGMRELLGVRTDDKPEEGSATLENKTSIGSKVDVEFPDKISEQLRKAFRIEAVGLMSLWFSFGPGVLARFVVEWESGKEGCTMHVSPDQLWPHTKFLEDFINGAEVASLLDCIRLTAVPLHALAAATRPARAGPASGSLSAMPGSSPIPKQNAFVLPSSSLSNVNQTTPVPPAASSVASSVMVSLGSHALHGAAMLAAGRGGPGIVPSSLLPFDVSVVLRGPYWIRIIYRKDFAVDMRCFGGDHVWLQPATPPKEGHAVGGSLPCPQFRPFIMEHVAQELNGLEPNLSVGQQTVGLVNLNSPNPSLGSQLAVASGNRSANASGIVRPASLPGNHVTGLSRIGNGPMASSNLSASSGMPLRRSLGTGVPIHLRGELNTAFIGLGDDGGYGGGWVPLVALKKVLRGILKYLGVLWLFAQLPDLLKEILSSILKDNEGALLNLDQEQPALRFFVG